MITTDRYIGYTLERLMDERDIWQAELARRAKTDRACVSYLVRGLKRMPRLEQAYDFSKVLGISLDTLWYECERDWRTEGYSRWLDRVERRYRRGRYAERDAEPEFSRPSDSTACAGGILVAGEGVEPPTQGFSVSRHSKVLASRPRILFRILNAA